MTIYDILEQISKNGSSKNKLKILTDHKSNYLLKRVFYLAYSKSIRFGIKKVPELEHANGKLSLDAVLTFMESKLATREITGNAAIDALKSNLECLSHDDQIVAIRVLSKDLEIGASASSANKVWKDLIPKQPQMLANPNSEKNLKNIVFPAYAQLKADGARCFIEVSDTGVTMLSRSGKEYTGLADIAEQAYKRWDEEYREQYPFGVMLDGELVSYNSDNVQSRTLSNGLANKSLSGTISEDEAKTMRHECWDIVDLIHVYSDVSETLYDDRFKTLGKFCSDLEGFIVIENTVVNNIQESKNIYNGYVNRGLEGIILKNIKSPWENKRSKNLVKFKEIYTIDLEIVDWYLHKKDPQKIGGFTAKTRDGIILVDVGSGLTDTDQEHIGEDVYGNNVYQDIPMEKRSDTNRAKLFTIRDTLKGMIIECECNGYLFSKNWSDGDTLSTFLGVFKKFRIDKTEANTFEEAFGTTYEEAVDLFLSNKDKN